MPRIARIVVPGLPQHVTQRGVRSLDVFDDDGDYELYLHLMREHGERTGLTFLAWCLLSNHIHLIVVPKREDSLARGIGEAHRLYTRAKNFRAKVRGYLFQGRFGSCILDEPHLVAAARYVDLNPVAAGIVVDPARYQWSSAAFHVGNKKTDPLVEDRSLCGLVRGARGWRRLLADGMDELAAKELEKRLSTGRPWAEDRFVARPEKRTGKSLRRGKPGPPKGRPRARRRRGM